MWSLFMQYWELTLLLLTWASLAAVAARRRFEWGRGRFREHVGFSLNYLEPDGAGGERLALRTLFEDSAERVWLNVWGVRAAERAAHRTTRERPFLKLASPRDRDQILRGALNVLAKRFAPAYLARSLGLPVASDRFLFGVTWERYGDVHTQKLRVMVARPAALERLFEAGAAARVGFESETHRPRLETLREMWRLWRSPDPEERACVGSVELGLPRP